MKVTIIDRKLQGELWGRGYTSIGQVLVTLEIPDKCPICGGPRGKPEMRRLCEDGEWYNVSVWQNPCGHLDCYEYVLKEAVTI